MTHTVRCPTCKGKGKKTLGTAYSQTLDALHELGGRGSCKQVEDTLRRQGLLNGDNESTVVQKRMSRMEAMGLVKKTTRVAAKQVESAAFQKVWLYQLQNQRG